jgi:hypothetical protein
VSLFLFKHYNWCSDIYLIKITRKQFAYYKCILEFRLLVNTVYLTDELQNLVIRNQFISRFI